MYFPYIYNAAGNNNHKIKKLFRVISASIVIHNNKIVAHERRLIDYFELMSSKTMYCPLETDKHSANALCLSVSSGHYIVLVDIISNN